MRTILLLPFFLIATAQAQVHVFPTHWFVGFKDHALNLLVRGEGVGAFTSARIQYPGVKLVKIRQASSPNYLFIDLLVEDAAKPEIGRAHV